MNKPYKTPVLYGSHAFSRGTNETAISRLFLYGAHVITKPYKTAVSYGSGHDRNRCFSTVSLRCTVLLKTAVSYGSDAICRGTSETAVSLRAPYE